MKSIQCLLLMLLGLSFAHAQSLPCGGNRFVKSSFSSTVTTPGVLFGRNTTFGGVSQDLYMDIFEPATDTAAIRPLFIFAFGGAFVSGDRTQLARVCDSLAAKGYVAAAIDYRLYDSPAGALGLVINPNDAIDAVAKGMSDIKAAIRYFKRDAATVKTYRVDTASIFLGGISSGSIAALHTAYINTLSETQPPVTAIIIQNGGIEGNTDLPGSPLIGTYSFQGIRGVWNMSGALYDSGYIKTGDPALFGIHGSADDIVPFGYGRLFSGYTTNGVFACGSSSLNNQANKVGVPAKFIPVIGGDHVEMYFDTARVRQIDSVASTFFASILCPSVLAVSGARLKGSVADGRVALNWQTLSENASRGFIIEKQLPSGWTNLGELSSKAANGNSSVPLDYTFYDIQPQQGLNLYRLKVISLNGEIVYSNTFRITWNGKAGSLFVVYPNPAGAVLRYKTSPAGQSLKRLKIYSADMRLMQTNILNATQSVSISGLPRGLYLAIVWDKQNRQAGVGWFRKI